MQRPFNFLDLCNPMLLLLCTSLLISGCAIGKKTITVPTPVEIEQQLHKAREQQKKGQLQKASSAYEKALSCIPPSDPRRVEISLELMRLYQLSASHEKLLELADQFESFYPSHPQMDAVLWLKALTYLPLKNNQLQNISSHDLKQLITAKIALGTLLQEFPHSDYHSQARLYFIQIHQQLALHELQVGLWYQSIGQLAAAAARAQRILKEYPRTQAVPGALKLLAEVNESLSNVEAAQYWWHLLHQYYPNYAAK